MTGEETDEVRKQLVEDAGNPNTITIATALLGRGTDITPQHDEGLFVMQCYMDTERTTRQILGRAARNGKVGKYLAIYDENGFTHHHEMGALRKMNVAQQQVAIADLQQKINKEGAIERHYIQEVSGVQYVFLSQFDEWQAMLKLVADKSTHEELDKKLLVLREELITGLSEEWKKQLEDSDPRKEYPNPYVRRNENGTFKTTELDQALGKFEAEAVKRWKETRSSLYRQLDVDTLDPVNQMRAHLLSHVNMSEQLKLRKLTMRAELKTAKNEQANAVEHVNHAMDVDAAMLKFSADALTPEQTIACQNRTNQTQLDLIRTAFNVVIAKASFKDNIKQGLKIPDGDLSFGMFATAFHNFEENSAKSLADRYQMQPTFIEFLNVFKQAQKQPNPAIPADVIVTINDQSSRFVSDVATQVADDLEKNLSWAKKENKGFGFWIERTKVQLAAEEILKATDELKQAAPDNKAEKIKALYIVLQQQSIKLDGLWIFSLGHTNTRKLINNTLQMLDKIGPTADIPLSLKNEAREQAISELYMDKFKTALDEAAQKIPLASTDEWKKISDELETIHKGNNSLYVFYELEACLNRHKASCIDPMLRQPLQDALHRMRHDLFDIEQKHRNLLSSSQFLQSTQAKLSDGLSQINGISSEQLKLSTGHTGVSEYYELVIKGTGMTNELFKGFTHYNDQQKALEKQLTFLRDYELSSLTEKQQALHALVVNPLVPVKLATIQNDNDLSTKINQQIVLCNKKIDLVL